MKHKINRFFLILILLLVLRITTSAQNNESIDSIPLVVKKTNPAKLAVVLGVTSLTLAASYNSVRNIWWKDQIQSFHFDNGPDYLYAKNIDKCAHFMGGLISAELLHDALKWTGMKENKSYFYSFLLGFTMHSFIELKDGFALTYGFSIGDLSAGTFGSAIPLLKYKFKKLDALNFKFSYYQHDTYFFYTPRASGKHNWKDDYMNQTFWITASVNDWLPKGSKAEKIWPDFLCIAGGFGVDNTLNNYYLGVNEEKYKGVGNYEYFLSLDIDWRKIIPQKSSGQIMIARTLNYIKIPLPTLRVSPSAQFYWVFW